MDNAWERLVSVIKNVDIDSLTKLLTEISSKFTKNIRINYGSALIPLESLSNVKVFKNIEMSDAFNYLAKNKITVSSLDSSHYNSSPHTMISFMVINVGWWLMDYSKSVEERGSEFYIYPFNPGDSSELLVKESEIKTLNKLLSKFKKPRNFLLLDEALNAVFTLNWNYEIRKSYITKIQELLKKLVINNILPVAVFYTRAHDIVRGLKSLGVNENLPDVSDRFIMNKILSVGERSCTFYVYSKALEGVDLELIAFYLKLGEGNVVRIEIPYVLKNFINEVHAVILANSILGNGYPLAMIRAHEEAVINYDLRRFIDEEIAKRLGLPTIELFLSGKARSKRWGLV